MVDGDRMSARISFLRVAVWGQALGILAFATVLAIEDAPDYFARTSPWAVALPLAAIVGVQPPGIADSFNPTIASSSSSACFMVHSGPASIAAEGLSTQNPGSADIRFRYASTASCT